MATWIEDANGNKCSVEWFGSREKAKAALDSLRNCENCTNCSGCSGCSRCSRCSDCSGCSGCSDCSGCYEKNGAKSVAPGEVNAGPPPIPVIPNIHQTIYAAASEPGSLNMKDVHTCEKTHCRGGWVVTLAGDAGRALERFYNWELAAMLIYDASAPGFKINPARFYDENDAALADMKRSSEAAETTAA